MWAAVPRWYIPYVLCNEFPACWQTTHPLHRAQRLMGRTSDSRLREPEFESCAAMLNPWASLFTLHCSSSLSCIHEYLAMYSGGYVYEQPSRINCSIWLDASQRSRDGIWVNRSVREVKCKALWTVLRTGYWIYINLPFLHTCCYHTRRVRQCTYGTHIDQLCLWNRCWKHLAILPGVLRAFCV